MDKPDTLLARRWQLGDVSSAAALVERYTDVLGAVAYGIVGDFTLAEDVVQETFARAARRIRTLRDPARLGAWLVGIARHVAHDVLRKRVRETPWNGQEPRSNQGGPGREAERSELRSLLHKAIADLPEDQRDVFSMKYMAGMSYRDIAHALGMTSDAVSQKLWRVRQKLQSKLEGVRP